MCVIYSRQYALFLVLQREQRYRKQGDFPFILYPPKSIAELGGKESCRVRWGMLPGFGLEISWKGSLFLGEIFSFSRRKTFISCPGSEKLQACDFLRLPQRGDFGRDDKNKERGQELYGGCPQVTAALSLGCSPPRSRERKDLQGLFTYLTIALQFFSVVWRM